MAEPQLSVRSARASDLAHRLARREPQSATDLDLDALIRADRIEHTGAQLCFLSTPMRFLKPCV